MSPAMIAAAALIVGVLALGTVAFLLLAKRGGEEVADAQVTVVQAVDPAKDAQAQSDVRNAIVAAKTAYIDAGSYDGVTPQSVGTYEPALTFTSGASTGPGVVSLAATGQDLGVAVLSESGTCFWYHGSLGGDGYGTGTPCTGQAALAATGASW
jgi:hypothetical protein